MPQQIYSWLASFHLLTQNTKTAFLLATFEYWKFWVQLKVTSDVIQTNTNEEWLKSSKKALAAESNHMATKLLTNKTYDCLVNYTLIINLVSLNTVKY